MKQIQDMDHGMISFLLKFYFFRGILIRKKKYISFISKIFIIYK